MSDHEAPPLWEALSDDDGYDPSLGYDPYPPDHDPPVWYHDPYPPDYEPPVEALAGGSVPDIPPQGWPPPDPDEDQGWAWHDTRLIGVDRGADAGAGRYEIGALDLYANAHTGDMGGSYLPIASFSHEVLATEFYHDLQAQIHAQGLAPHEVIDFADVRAFQMNAAPPNWRTAEPAEYAAYEYVRGLEAFDPALADDPPDAALDPLIQTAVGLGGIFAEHEVEPEVEPESVEQALKAIGVQAENVDPDADSPPFYDPETGTAYWIGVFQPDPDDRANCVTSILSLGRNPETSALEAHLAPCVVGDWDKAYSAAEYLIQVAGKGGIEQLFDTAEGMALATDQRAFWQTERGMALEPDATREIADYARDTWEVEL
jgi:hypothetical protein